MKKHGGIFIVDPSHKDLGIAAIHGQTKLLREYALTLTYGVNDLKMADRTHHLSEHCSHAVF